MIWKPSTLRAIRHSMSGKTEYAIDVEYERVPDTAYRGSSSASSSQPRAGQQFIFLVPDQSKVARQLDLVTLQYDMGFVYAPRKTSYERTFRELLDTLRIPIETPRGRETYRAISAKIRKNPDAHAVAIVDFRRG